MMCLGVNVEGLEAYCQVTIPALRTVSLSSTLVCSQYFDFQSHIFLFTLTRRASIPGMKPLSETSSTRHISATGYCCRSVLIMPYFTATPSRNTSHTFL